MLPQSAAADEVLAAEVSGIVNAVYKTAEAGLWAGDADRTSAAEVAGLVAAGEIAVARLAGRVVGCVRVRTVAEGVGEFGLLAAAPDVQGAGVGRELVRFAEDRCRALGYARMQLELLVPRSFTHPSKEFLATWYTRLGYRLEEKSTIEQAYPHLAPLLATPCDFLVYRKDLKTGS
ncbi:GNAT family N-acetyltransferase [Amycolatopsis rhabdoformis]|uniref:GNAT family N-acetyltransferase n=1 Tax=Amycolatopsis rhabdoformis TaxID=1448059 RepID=A0ABZ1IBW4_9PSEU|nr:GNAT family N-acetyltransferase [Amycolatopsis rhabdoformis]WSE31443.1 GNAT family N-acetyltransferase [Amycolatopsis rhabdoformis]